MKSATTIIILTAMVVFARVANASDETRRQKEREKRSSAFESGPPSGIMFGSNSDRDFISGLGHSSSLKYGPGLGLSSNATLEEDLSPSPSSPSPSLASDQRIGGSLQWGAAVIPVPRYTTTGPYPAFVPTSYVSGQPTSAPAAHPFVVVSVTYGPTDPGYAPPNLGYIRSDLGYVPSDISYDDLYSGWRPFDYGPRRL